LSMRSWSRSVGGARRVGLVGVKGATLGLSDGERDV
jgi:hypothetical protein